MIELSLGLEFFNLGNLGDQISQTLDQLQYGNNLLTAFSLHYKSNRYLL